MASQPRLDLKVAVRAHKASFGYAFGLNNLIAKRPSSHPVAGAALMVISHDAICLHRAVGDLVFAGWAFAAPMLLRTMLEGLSGAVAITNSRRPNLAGFRYFHFRSRETRRHIADARPELVSEMRRNIDLHMGQLSAEDQTAAQGFLSKKGVGEYWFSEEFGSVTDILKRYAIKDVQILYRELSDAVHFGYIGMRLYRDEPDVLNVGLRKDSQSAASALIGSSRVLAELTRARGIFEGLPVDAYRLVTRLIRASEV